MNNSNINAETVQNDWWINGISQPHSIAKQFWSAACKKIQRKGAKTPRPQRDPKSLLHS